MMAEEEAATAVERLLARQLYGVLATQGEGGGPHLSIVAFVSADDLRSLVFATPRGSRKFANLSRRPEAALFVDDRRDRIGDLMQVVGVEASGRAGEVPPEEREPYRRLFLAKYPEMRGFLDDPDSALVRIEVAAYDAVDRFQRMRTFRPGSSV